jgi:CDP-glycerol glycerophosphotransferase (TagB/SpsB family)
MPLLETSSLAWNMKQDDIIKLVNLVAGSNIVLNSCSTFSIDGLLHERPVIVTAFDSNENLNWQLSVKRVMEYVHYRKLVDTGGVSKVSSYSELDEMIKQYLANEKLNLAERKTAKILECGENDGKASQRISEAIIDILKR